jgi:D-lactate dehydrogenase
MHIRNPERLAEIQRLTANESLLSRPNVVFTPHIAFNSFEAIKRIDEVTAQNIIAFAAGTPINLVTGKGPVA